MEDSIKALLDAIVIPDANGTRHIFHNRRCPADYVHRERNASVLLAEADALLDAGAPSVGLVLGRGVVFRDDAIRALMHIRNHTEAMIALPGGLFTETSIPATVVLLSKAPVRSFRMINLDGCSIPTSTQKWRVMLLGETIAQVKQKIEAHRAEAAAHV